LIFHKPSLRTRLSFEVAMTQLGGSSVFITEREIGMGSREPVADVARVLSGYVDGIMIRTFQHDLCENLARHATVPVINGLTDWLHPCQILADLFTLRERRFDLDRIKVAFIGDGNNVANSWIEAAMLFGLEVRIACPEGYEPDPKLVARVSESGKGSARVIRSPAEASAGAGGRAGEAAPRVPELPGELLAPGQGGAGRGRDALPSGAPGGGDHRRDDGEPPLGRVSRGGEPDASPEGDPLRADGGGESAGPGVERGSPRRPGASRGSARRAKGRRRPIGRARPIPPVSDRP
jgi:hypothetical protein